MNPLRWLEYLALELQGTRRCNTPEKLLRYMKGKDLDALHFWVEARMWYQKDGTKPWRQNWTPLEQVLARDVPGKDVETDCEERGIVKKFVINKLGWGRAHNLVVWADNHTMDTGADKRTWCHAACLARDLTISDFAGLILMDYKMHYCITEREAVMAMGRYHRVTPTRWCYCEDNGKIVSQIYRVSP